MGSVKWPGLDSIVLLGTSVGSNSITLQVCPALEQTWWIPLIPGLQQLNQLHQECTNARHPKTFTSHARAVSSGLPD